MKYCHNISDLQQLSQSKLPKVMFDYIDGFAEDGVCGLRNTDAFSNIRFVPRALRDVTEVDTTTTDLGQKTSLPLILAPTALSRMFHFQGETAVAKAAKKADIIYALSTMSSVPMEDVASLGGAQWFQVYVYKDRALVAELLQRVKASNFSTICLTVDAAVSGNREKDIRNGFTVPPKLKLRGMFESMFHPAWVWRHFTTPDVTTANISEEHMAGYKGANSFMQYTAEQLAPSVTWEDVKAMRDDWDGKFIVKGLMNPNDVQTAKDLGVDGVVLSNYGGRQLDHCEATIQMLPEIRERVGSDIESIIDGGIRRGTDVAKALILGANACMIGRPYLYGLTAGGEQGVSSAIEIFRTEFVRTLQLLGCTSIAELNPELLRY